MFVDDIQGGNTHVYLGYMNDWAYEYGGYSRRDYHKSKDSLEGLSPYTVNILNKKWEYSDAYNHHLLLYTQVWIQEYNSFKYEPMFSCSGWNNDC